MSKIFLRIHSESYNIRNMEHYKSITIATLSIPVAIVLSGLLAGLFYGYNCSVIKGLGKLNDIEYLSAYKYINQEIQNPTFFISFMGTLLALPLATWTNYSENGSVSVWLLAATFLYWFGVFGITLGCNVPLNNWLEEINLDSQTAETLHSIRQKFEGDWNKWHHIRTCFAILSFCCTVFSLVKLK